MKPTIRIARLNIVCTALLLSACAVGPDFKAPNAATAVPTQGSSAPALTRTLNISQQSLPEKWWTVFGDDTLNGLQEQLLSGSPTCKPPPCALPKAAPAKASPPRKAGRRWKPTHRPAAAA